MITDSATTGCGLDWFWRHPISQQSEWLPEYLWKDGKLESGSGRDLYPAKDMARASGEGEGEGERER
jgi:hypothetical protein